MCHLNQHWITCKASHYRPSQNPGKSLQKDVPKYKYVHVTPKAAPACPKQSTSPSNPDINILQLRVDGYIDKVKHASEWMEKYLQSQDIQSALKELQALKNTTNQSRSLIHDTLARFRNQSRK